MKTKILFILHLPPPNHGASKVGELIKGSKINKFADCRYISIKSSESIEEIGKVSLKKFYLVAELFFKILITLISFRPDKIYFTASTGGVALYRDILLSTLWKCYKLFKKTEIYYHYHTKGLNKTKNNILLKFFLKDINLILLSPLLKEEFEEFDYKNIFFLPNGVENPFRSEGEFLKVVNGKFKNSKREVLYLNHLIDTKGYRETLFLAKNHSDITFNFAGTFGSDGDREYFYRYIDNNGLKNILYHGFIKGRDKERLLQKAHALIYISKNDAFPLTLLEALSYGLPIFTTDEGSIPYIVDNRSGLIVKKLNSENLLKGLKNLVDNYINYETSIYCRDRYLNNFTLEKFENRLMEIML